MRAQETVKLLPVIQVVVMGSRVGILMVGDSVFHARLREKRDYRIHDIRLHMTGNKTTVVLLVVDQESRTWGHHGGQVGVIGNRDQVTGNLFQVTDAATIFQAVQDPTMAGHRYRQLDPGIE